MEELFLPTLHTFAMNNIFTGSMGAFRFRAKPNVVMATAKEVDFDQSSIFVVLSGGCSKSPIDLLKGAGVDMTTAEPVEQALELFGQLLDEMEALM